MTRKTYCGNLLWQSGLTLLVLLWQFTVAIRSDPVGSEVGIASRPGGDANMVFSVPMLDDAAFYRVTVSDR